MVDKEVNWLINHLRRVYSKTGLPSKCIQNQQTGEKIGRRKVYRCSKCNLECLRTDLQADHIEPVINPKTGFVDWNTFISRLFVPLSGLQALCAFCHGEKSAEENKKRRRKMAGKKKKKKGC